MSSLRDTVLLLVFAAGVTLAASGCKASESPPPAGGGTESVGFQVDPAFVSAGDAASGAELYRAQCVTCHGSAGDGRGPAGSAFQPPPTDFTATALPAHRVYTAIKEGGAAVGRSGVMPPFGSQFSESQLHDLVAYVLAFAE